MQPLTIETLASYLGGPVSALLAAPPFKNWTFARSVDDNIEEWRIDYVFCQNGVDFVGNRNDELTIIFLYSNKSRHFKEGVQDLPFASTRRAVLEKLGPPSKSGGRLTDPTLGEFGPWDRFARPGHTIHVAYRHDADIISQITLMRADVVPP